MLRKQTTVTTTRNENPSSGSLPSIPSSYRTWAASFFDATEAAVDSQVNRVCNEVPYEQFYGRGIPTAGLGTPGDIYIDRTPWNLALYIRFPDYWQKQVDPGQESIAHPLNENFVLSFAKTRGPSWILDDQVEEKDSLSDTSITEYLRLHLESVPEPTETSQQAPKRKPEEPEEVPRKKSKTSPASQPSLNAPASQTPSKSPRSRNNATSKFSQYSDGPYAIPLREPLAQTRQMCRKPAYSYDSRIPENDKGSYGDIFFLLSPTNEIQNVYFKANEWTVLPTDLTTIHKGDRIRHPEKPNFMLNVTVDTFPGSIWVTERRLEKFTESQPIPTASDWFTWLLDTSPFQLKRDLPPSHLMDSIIAENATLRSRCSQLEKEISELKTLTLPASRLTKGVQATPTGLLSTGAETGKVATRSTGVLTEETLPPPSNAPSELKASIAVETETYTSSQLVQTNQRSTSEFGVQVSFPEPSPSATRTNDAVEAEGSGDTQDIQNLDDNMDVDEIDWDCGSFTMESSPEAGNGCEAPRTESFRIINGQIQDTTPETSDGVMNETSLSSAELSPDTVNDEGRTQGSAQAFEGADEDFSVAAQEDILHPAAPPLGSSKEQYFDSDSDVDSLPSKGLQTSAKDRVAELFFQKHERIDQLICRICLDTRRKLAKFPAEADMVVLSAHVKSEHEEYWKRILAMTDEQADAIVREVTVAASTAA